HVLPISTLLVPDIAIAGHYPWRAIISIGTNRRRKVLPGRQDIPGDVGIRGVYSLNTMLAWVAGQPRKQGNCTRNSATFLRRSDWRFSGGRRRLASPACLSVPTATFVTFVKCMKWKLRVGVEQSFADIPARKWWIE